MHFAEAEAEAKAEDIKLLLTHIRNVAPASMIAVVPWQELRKGFMDAIKEQIDKDANSGAAKVKHDNRSDAGETWDDQHQQKNGYMLEAIANMKRCY